MSCAVHTTLSGPHSNWTALNPTPGNPEPSTALKPHKPYPRLRPPRALSTAARKSIGLGTKFPEAFGFRAYGLHSFTYHTLGGRLRA